MILETATPAELQSIAKGMQIMVGCAPSPFGECLIADSAYGICDLSFFDPAGEEQAIAEFLGSWSHADIQWNHRHAAKLADQIFSPLKPSEPPLRILASGTEFQMRVWRELLRVPFGESTSYAMLAAAIGHPRACRAVGSAVGANSIAFLIPCHRVIHSDGALGQYRWGAVRKRAMLAWEKTSLSSSALITAIPKSAELPSLAQSH